MHDGVCVAVNLPCVVEVHKTIDNSTLFKCGDIGQVRQDLDFPKLLS